MALTLGYTKLYRRKQKNYLFEIVVIDCISPLAIPFVKKKLLLFFSSVLLFIWFIESNRWSANHTNCASWLIHETWTYKISARRRKNNQTNTRNSTSFDDKLLSFEFESKSFNLTALYTLYAEMMMLVFKAWLPHILQFNFSPLHFIHFFHICIWNFIGILYFECSCLLAFCSNMFFSFLCACACV